VLPALIRKIHLGKALMEGDWDAIRTDLNKRPVEGVDGGFGEEEIVEVLGKYGVGVDRGPKTDDRLVRVEIWGTGSPMREFLWSEDMADACVYVMESVDFKDIVRINGLDGPGKEIRNVHLNIGTGKDISIKALAHLIKETIGFKGELYFNTSKPDGTLRKLTDPSKLQQLGWKHSVELQDGVRKMYEWYLEE
jgi:GDP-L-fucose synthase